MWKCGRGRFVGGDHCREQLTSLPRAWPPAREAAGRGQLPGSVFEVRRRQNYQGGKESRSVIFFL